MEFFCLTPLPGSEDHRTLVSTGVWMDPDMNTYDTEHVTTGHALMTDEEFLGTYRDAWRAFYTPDHVETLMRRAVAYDIPPRKVMRLALYFYGSQAVEGIHPLQGGLFRRKHRRDRRPGRRLENPFVFYARYLGEIASKSARLLALYWTYKRRLNRVVINSRKSARVNLALTPASAEDVDPLGIFGRASGPHLGEPRESRQPRARIADAGERRGRRSLGNFRPCLRPSPRRAQGIQAADRAFVPGHGRAVAIRSGLRDGRTASQA